MNCWRVHEGSSANGKQSVKSKNNFQRVFHMPLFHTMQSFPPASLRDRGGVVVLVLVLHAALGVVWMMQPEQPEIVLNEMSVSVAMQQAEVVQPQALPEPLPLSRPQPKIEQAVRPVAKQVVQGVAAAVPQPLPVVAALPAAAPPAVAVVPMEDSEPDYKAGYLNNPRPSYPMVARRMSWEGKVILNVEVLAEGACGAVNVFRSSGHEVLDNAAMNTVKNWRFIPARHGDRSVTQWFKVPIHFSLEDNEA